MKHQGKKLTSACKISHGYTLKLALPQLLSGTTVSHISFIFKDWQFLTVPKIYNRNTEELDKNLLRKKLLTAQEWCDQITSYLLFANHTEDKQGEKIFFAGSALTKIANLPGNLCSSNSRDLTDPSNWSIQKTCFGNSYMFLYPAVAKHSTYS